MSDKQPSKRKKSGAEFRKDRAVARTLIGGRGVFIHIFMFCPTSFFSN